MPKRDDETQFTAWVPKTLANQVTKRHKLLKQTKKTTMERMCRAYLKMTEGEAVRVQKETNA